MPTSPTWTREAIVAALRADYERTGRTPTAHDWRAGAYGRPTTETVCRRFGSWNTAIVHADLPFNRPGRPQVWTPDLIINAMLDWVAEHRKWPTSYQWRRSDPRGRWPSTQRVKKAFGTWRAAKRAAGWRG